MSATCRFALAALALASVAGCNDVVDPMTRQGWGKSKWYWKSDVYADGRAMRQPPAYTVPRERPLDAYKAPPPLTLALLERGRERFDITCAACHGRVGDGDSEVARKMSLRAPPTLHTDKLRAYTQQQMFDVITNGYGYMPSYAGEIAVSDRWAITAYVKALQRSQHAPLEQAPPHERQRLEESAK